MRYCIAISEALLSCAMDLTTYIADMGRRAALAQSLGSTPQYLWQIATGWRGKRASPELARKIAQATAELGPEPVPLESLRPDIWPPADAANAAQPTEQVG